MSDPTFPAKRHVKVPEHWFNDNNQISGNVVLGVEQGGIFPMQYKALCHREF